MNNAQALIQAYNTGFYICMAVTILALAGAVLMFFRFDIRMIFAIRTGRAERMTVQKMQEANARTGALRPDAALEYTTDGLAAQPPAEETSLLTTTSMETTLLTAENGPAAAGPSSRPAAPAGDFRFVVTERTIVVHTDEVI